MSKRPTKESLVGYYSNQGLPLKEVGNIFHVCPATIRNALAFYGIPVRHRTPSKRIHPRGSKHGSGVRVIYHDYLRKALARKLSFDLTEDDVFALSQQNCRYCGSLPSRKKGRHLFNGIDRKDNSKGYTKNNVCPCCPTCNWTKGTMTEQEFIEWVHRVSDHLRANEQHINDTSCPDRQGVAVREGMSHD